MGEKPSLYADIDGTLVPVTQGIEGHKYQVSWTKDTKVAKTGDHSVNLYDSEGYTAVKRSRERGEAVTTSPLVTIVVSYPGSYTGPLLNSEDINKVIIFIFLIQQRISYNLKEKLLMISYNSNISFILDLHLIYQMSFTYSTFIC